MKMRYIALLLVVVAIMSVGCGSGRTAPAATAAPTSEPTSPPTPEPTVTPEPTATLEPTTAPTEPPTATPVEAEATTTSLFSEEQIETLAAIAPPPQLSERELGVHTVPCLPGTAVDREGEVEGEDYVCGVFTVPQNWDEPDDRNLDLTFLVAKATGASPQADPLIHLAGGPGAASSQFLYFDKYETVRAERDIILFDVRGVGLSQRLGYQECMVLAAQNGAPEEQVEALLGKVGTLLTHAGVAPDSVPAGEPNTPLINQVCWEQFTGQGLDLNQFTTANTARDVVELIKALGYESFNIESESYGTRVAMTVMRDIPTYPDAPELRSVILDSAYPPSVYLTRSRTRSYHDYILELLSGCQSDPACIAAYPDLDTELTALLDGLEEEPLTVDGETITLEEFAAQLASLKNQTRAGYMPRMITELDAGVLDTYLALRDRVIGTYDPEETPIPPDMSDPVVAFIVNGQELLTGTTRITFPDIVNSVLVGDDPLGQLQQLVAVLSLPEEIQEMATALTAEDIAASAYVAGLPEPEESELLPEELVAKQRLLVADSTADLLGQTIDCAEDLQLQRFEDALTSYNDLRFPQLGRPGLEASRAEMGKCENWPVEAAPIEIKDPVSSTVRTLILQSDYDQSTPVYMGRRAHRELENSLYVYVPQSGHGAWLKGDNCVGRIAAAFIQDPDAELDMSCLEAREPVWSLPGESLR